MLIRLESAVTERMRQPGRVLDPNIVRTGLDPRDILAVTELATLKIRIAALRGREMGFKRFTKVMEGEFGERVSDYLVEMYKAAKAGAATIVQKTLTGSPPFYKKLVEVARGSGMAPIPNIESLIRTFEKSALSKEDMKWSGVVQWLRGQRQGTVTKNEVLDYLRSHALEVEEDIYGAPSETLEFKETKLVGQRALDLAQPDQVIPLTQRQYDTWRALTDESDVTITADAPVPRPGGGVYRRDDPRMAAGPGRQTVTGKVRLTRGNVPFTKVQRSLLDQDVTDLTDRQIASLTKHDYWIAEFPSAGIGRGGTTFESKEQAATYVQEEMQRKVPRGKPAKWRQYTLSGLETDTPASGEQYRNVLLVLPSRLKAPGATDFVEDFHYPGTKNVIAFIRFNIRKTRDGRTVLFVEEIQSDWHEDARKVRTKEIKRRLKVERERLVEEHAAALDVLAAGPIFGEEAAEAAFPDEMGSALVPGDFGYQRDTTATAKYTVAYDPAQQSYVVTEVEPGIRGGVPFQETWTVPEDTLIVDPTSDELSDIAFELAGDWFGRLTELPDGDVETVRRPLPGKPVSEMVRGELNTEQKARIRQRFAAARTRLVAAEEEFEIAEGEVRDMTIAARNISLEGQQRRAIDRLELLWMMAESPEDLPADFREKLNKVWLPDDASYVRIPESEEVTNVESLRQKIYDLPGAGLKVAVTKTGKQILWEFDHPLQERAYTQWVSEALTSELDTAIDQLTEFEEIAGVPTVPPPAPHPAHPPHAEYWIHPTGPIEERTAAQLTILLADDLRTYQDEAQVQGGARRALMSPSLEQLATTVTEVRGFRAQAAAKAIVRRRVQRELSRAIDDDRVELADAPREFAADRVPDAPFKEPTA